MPDDFAVSQYGFVVKEERFRIVQQELHQPPLKSRFPFAQHRVATDEVGLCRFDGKAKPGLQHMVLAGDVMPEMAKALFDPAAIHHMQSAKLEIVVEPCLPDRFEGMSGHIRADIEFPAKFAHIGNAVRPGNPHAQFDLLRGPERVRRIREVVGRDRLQQIARSRPHNGKHALRRRHIGDNDRVVAKMPSHPVFICNPRRGGRDHEIGGFRQPVDGDIRFDAAMRVEELRIDDLADGNGHVPAADMVEKSLRVASLNAQLAEGRHVVHADARADGAMLGSGVLKPVLPLP